MQKLNSRSAHTFHALQGEPNRFRLVNLTAKGARAVWAKEKVQSENINGVMRIIGKGRTGTETEQVLP